MFQSSRRIFAVRQRVGDNFARFLLRYLIQNRGRVLSRDLLLTNVWGYRYTGGTRTVDVHVAQVRAKLGDASPIRTVRGVGYRYLQPE